MCCLGPKQLPCLPMPGSGSGYSQCGKNVVNLHRDGWMFFHSLYWASMPLSFMLCLSIIQVFQCLWRSLFCCLYGLLDVLSNPSLSALCSERPFRLKPFLLTLSVAARFFLVCSGIYKLAKGLHKDRNNFLCSALTKIACWMFSLKPSADQMYDYHSSLFLCANSLFVVAGICKSGIQNQQVRSASDGEKIELDLLKEGWIKFSEQLSIHPSIHLVH